MRFSKEDEIKTEEHIEQPAGRLRSMVYITIYSFELRYRLLRKFLFFVCRIASCRAKEQVGLTSERCVKRGSRLIDIVPVANT
jgi:hypothetical protein